MGDDERAGVLESGDRAVEQPAQQVRMSTVPIARHAQAAMRRSTRAIVAAYTALHEYEPTFIGRAGLEWYHLRDELPRRDLMQKVRFKPLSEHPHDEMQTFAGVQAWTNSSTDIYLADPTAPGRELDGSEPVYWRVILYHEALHIKQFVEHGGPPDTYTQMVKYETDAYLGTRDWLNDTQHPSRYPSSEIQTASEVMQDNYFDFVFLQQETADDEREQKYREFLLQGSYLPKHGAIEELYGR